MTGPRVGAVSGRRAGRLAKLVLVVAVVAACSGGTVDSTRSEPAPGDGVVLEPGAGDNRGAHDPASPSLNDPTSPVPAGSGSSTPTSTATSTTPVPVDGSLPEFDRLFPDMSQLPINIVVDDTVYDLATDPITEVWTSSDVILSETAVPTIVNEGVMALVALSEVSSVPETALLDPSVPGNRVSSPPTGTLVLDRVSLAGDESAEVAWDRSRIELAREVSSFVVGPAGRTFAWTEPVIDGSSVATKLVMAEFPYGRITSSFVFRGVESGPVRTTGRAEIVGIAGDNVLIRAGDPSQEVALVTWVPAKETTYRVMNYDPWAVGPTWANRLVLGQAETGCGVVVEITADGPADPVDGADTRPDLPCNASRAATISHSGEVLAGAGTTGDNAIDGDPVVVVAPATDESDDMVRSLRIEGVPGAYWEPRGARWLDALNLVVLASSHNGRPRGGDDFAQDPDTSPGQRTVERWESHWGLYHCDLEAGSCRLASSIGFQPTWSDQIMLVPLRIR